MKKIYILFSLLALLTLTACAGNNDVKKVGIVLEENSITLSIGQYLDLYEGVSVYDKNGEEVANFKETLNVQSIVPVNQSGRVTEEGRFIIAYSITLEGTLYEAGKTVNVVAAPEVNSDWTTNGMQITMDGNDTIISYGAAATEWWNSHAIYAISNYTLTNNAVVLTATGVSGHNYILKVESTTGAQTEVEFTGTGNSEVVKVFLDTKFTDDDIKGINQILLFNSASTTAGEIAIHSLEFKAETAPEFTPYWEVHGATKNDNGITFYEHNGNFWDLLAIYHINGYKGSAAVSIDFTAPENHVYKFKLETSTGKAYETADITTTGTAQTFDIIPNFDAADFALITKVIVFNISTNGDAQSLINISSIKGITADEITPTVDVFNGKFYGGSWLELNVKSNVANIDTVANFTLSNITVSNLGVIEVGNTFMYGTEYIVFQIQLDSNFELEQLYDITFDISYNGKFISSETYQISTVTEKLPEGDIVIPENASVATLIDGTTEVYDGQYLKFAIQFDDITKAQADEMGIKLISEAYPNAQISIIGQYGDTGIHVEVNLGTAYPEGYGNDDFDKLDFTIILFSGGVIHGAYYN